MRATNHQADPEFRRNEFFETLLRVRRDEPRRYEREVSPGTRRSVDLYEEKSRATERAPHVTKARAA